MLDGRTMVTVLPDIAADLGVSVPAAGIAITAYLIPYGVFQLAWGPLADRVGPMRVISVAIVALHAASWPPRRWPGSLPVLAAIRLVTGGVAAAFFPLALVAIGELVPYERRQEAIANLVAASACGLLAGAALGGILTELFSWRAIFVVDASLAALLIVPLWRARDAVPARGRQPSQHARHPAEPARPRAVRAGRPGGRRVPRRQRLPRRAAARRARPLLRADGRRAGRRGGGLGERDAADPPAAARGVGERRMMLGGATMMGAGFLVAAAAPSWVLVVPGVALVGAGLPICHSVLQTRGTEIAPEARGTAISFFVFALFMGGAIGTALLGVVLDARGFTTTIALAGSALLVLAYAASRTSSPRSSRNVSTA